MKKILKEGKIKLIIPENGGGLSGEVHLVKYGKEKFITRRCKTVEKAKSYEELDDRFSQYGFLPKLLGRYGKDVLYEFIDGRDLQGKESMGVFEQIGSLSARINKVKVKGDVSKRFNRQLEELVTGKFSISGKVLMKQVRLKEYKKPKSILSRAEGDHIDEVYRNLKRKVKPYMTLDAGDVAPGNFRLGEDGRVYFVDVEAIKPRVRGLGIAKFFLTWGDTEARQRAFLRGYSKVSSTKFLTEEYRDFIFLNFLMQKVNYNVNIFQDRGYQKPLRQMNQLVRKYS